MGNPDNFVYKCQEKKHLPWVLSQQGSHQHATHGNGETSFLVGTSIKYIF